MCRIKAWRGFRLRNMSSHIHVSGTLFLMKFQVCSQLVPRLGDTLLAVERWRQ
jgi:hypothetical protein